MPIVECTDYIVPQTVTAAPTITEGGGNGSGGDDEPIAPAGTLSDKFIMLTAIIAPFVGLVVAMALLGRYGWMGWLYLGLFLGGWTLTGRGVTIGFHRLLTHYSFETYRPLRAMWMILGALSVEGSPLVWCAVHRKHHEKSDHRGDPHSPHLHGEGLWNSLKGFWFSHAGWLLTGHWSYPNLQRDVPDLLRDKLLVGIDRVYYVWVILSLAIPTAIGGLGTFSWYGRAVRVVMGRSGEDLHWPSHHLERQFGLPHVWPPRISHHGPIHQQSDCGSAGLGGGMAQQPPRVSDFRTSWVGLVAVGSQLAAHQANGKTRSGLGRPRSVHGGDGSQAAAKIARPTRLRCEVFTLRKFASANSSLMRNAYAAVHSGRRLV